MKTAFRKSGDNLLLKSGICVVAAAGALLLLMRHAAPVEERNKYFGGGVWLLSARSVEEAKVFQRWGELNLPSNIFGYNSSGIFSTAVSRENKLELPVVRNADSFALLSRLSVAESVIGGQTLSLKSEPTSPAPDPGGAIGKMNKTRPFQISGLPVFDRQGEIVISLRDIPPAEKNSVLLIKADKDPAGTSFAVIKSSGDSQFDRRVIAALEQQRSGRQPLEGVLAVWPENRRAK